ncbi:transposase [bacterium]|nr:transposase [bacterium]
MPRKPLLRSNFLPYHVTARANNREPFRLSQSQVWRELTHACFSLSIIYEVEFHALVLMPNHFHMILTVPQHDLGKVMNFFISTVTKEMNFISGRSGHVFGGPYHWSLIGNSRYFGHALKYVYRNPVKAGICGLVEDYHFSTLQGLIGGTHLSFPIYFTRSRLELSLPSLQGLDILDWLNNPFPHEAETLIQKGLRKKSFDSILNRETRRSSKVLELLL